MELNKACDKIAKYLESATSTPIIVDVAETPVLDFLNDRFNIGATEFYDSSLFCGGDRLPQIDKLLHELQNRKKRTFLLHLSSFLKIEGEQYLKDTLRSMLDMSIEGKLVVVTYQCSEYLNFSDPRIEASGKIIKIDPVVGGTIKLPTLTFITDEFRKKIDVSGYGLNRFARYIETAEPDTVYIVTQKSKADFPNSLFPILQNSSAFDILSKTTPELSSLGDNAGTAEQWSWLLDELDKHNGWIDYINKKYGNTVSLSQNIGNINNKDKNEQWGYFIALKCFGVQGNEYLLKVIEKSSTLEEFWDNLYCEILNFECSRINYLNLYKERKEVLSKVNVPISVRATFCKQVQNKNEKAIYYLTDNSIQEKELIIELISEYGKTYDKHTLESILSIVYPDLNSYLVDFDYGSKELSEYFNSYRYCKLSNQITDEQRELVDKYSTNRIYYSLLDRRSSVVAKKDKKNAKMYFVDALGVEFLNYIRELCYAKNLSFDVDLAYCELPSITCMNKEFVEDFANHVDVKYLDNLKHEGNGNYNYEQTKLPIHIIEEMNILNGVMESVEKDLHDGLERIYLVSDHGASRLAVINESENKWEVKEKGQHSGRCCPKSDLDEKPDFAAEDNDYWCIANYDRFKGGRKANVEVHGGATLEEVIVPIIEIRKAGDKPKCEICSEYKTIVVSFKIKAKIQIFIAKQTDNARVFCNGKYYDAKPTETKYIYNVDMPEVKRGKHTIDVYDGSIRIAEGIEFEAKSAGATENRYF